MRIIDVEIAKKRLQSWVDESEMQGLKKPQEILETALICWMQCPPDRFEIRRPPEGEEEEDESRGVREAGSPGGRNQTPEKRPETPRYR